MRVGSPAGGSDGVGAGPARQSAPTRGDPGSDSPAHAKDFSEQGIETPVQMRDVMVGGPAKLIAEVAEQEGADLIVIGTRGHSGLQGIGLGSVTQRLLHLAHRHVLAIPPPA